MQGRLEEWFALRTLGPSEMRDKPTVAKNIAKVCMLGRATRNLVLPASHGAFVLGARPKRMVTTERCA